MFHSDLVQVVFSLQVVVGFQSIGASTSIGTRGSINIGSQEVLSLFVHIDFLGHIAWPVMARSKSQTRSCRCSALNVSDSKCQSLCDSYKPHPQKKLRSPSESATDQLLLSFVCIGITATS